jgi:hypothetical protein
MEVGRSLECTIYLIPPLRIFYIAKRVLHRVLQYAIIRQEVQMYKDKGKQKEAVLKAVHKIRGITEGITPPKDKWWLDPPVIPNGLIGDTELFRTLPVDVQRGILGVLESRKELGLHDDSVERIEAAVKYQAFLAGPYQEYQKIAREYLEEAKRRTKE